MEKIMKKKTVTETDAISVSAEKKPVSGDKPSLLGMVFSKKGILPVLVSAAFYIVWAVILYVVLIFTTFSLIPNLSTIVAVTLRVFEYSTAYAIFTGYFFPMLFIVAFLGFVIHAVLKSLFLKSRQKMREITGRMRNAHPVTENTNKQ